MFKNDDVAALFGDHRETFAAAAALARMLKTRFHDMDDAVDALILAAITGESLVMIGPPGTAKSRLVRVFADLVGLKALATQETANKKNEDYFEYLLTQFTEPSELFGYFDIAKAMDGKGLDRIETGMMQKAKVVFLDEVFNASSAILNSLLTFMNERRFHDRGAARDTRLKLFVSASNQVPTDPGLEAVYDRFLLRCRLENVAGRGMSQGDLSDLLGRAWTETHAAETGHDADWSDLLERMEAYREDVDARTRDGDLSFDPAHPVMPALAQLVVEVVRDDDTSLSNRRLVKYGAVILAQAMLRAIAEETDAPGIAEQDLDVILRFSVDDPDGTRVPLLRQNLTAG